MAPLSDEQRAVDLHVETLCPKVFEVPRGQVGRDAHGGDPLFAQHPRRQPRPLIVDVSLALLEDLRRSCLSPRAVDLERAHHQHIVAVLEPNVEAALDAKAGGVDEVGVLGSRRNQDRGTNRGSSRTNPARDGGVGALRVAPQAGGLDRLRHGLEKGVVAATARAAPGAALEVELLLDLVAARVRDLVTEIAKLGEIAPQGPFGDARAIGQLDGIQPRLGDDRGEHPQEAGEPLSPVHG